MELLWYYHVHTLWYRSAKDNEVLGSEVEQQITAATRYLKGSTESTECLKAKLLMLEANDLPRENKTRGALLARAKEVLDRALANAKESAMLTWYLSTCLLLHDKKDELYEVLRAFVTSRAPQSDADVLGLFARWYETRVAFGISERGYQTRRDIDEAIAFFDKWIPKDTRTEGVNSTVFKLNKLLQEVGP
jgi:hypothetical protein